MEREEPSSECLPACLGPLEWTLAEDTVARYEGDLGVSLPAGAEREPG